MKKIALAVGVACLGMSGLTQADEAMQFNFSGFGTLGATYNNNHEADFRPTLVMPAGPGASKATDPGVDTKLGLQGSAYFGRGLSGVVQVVVDRRYDNAYSPEFEWANLKYDISKNLYVRGGRVVAPVFMLSEQRNVGYSLTTVRTDAEVYSLNPITHLDGVDIGGKLEVAGGIWSLQATGGSTKLKLGAGVEISGSSAMFNTTYEIGESTFRLGYSDYKLDILPLSATTIQAFSGYRTAMSLINAGAINLGYPAASANVSFDDVKVRILGLGYAYDDGRWLAQSEYVRRRSDGYVVQDGDAWYLLGGYRLGKFTPYASYSKLKSKEPAGQKPAVSPHPSLNMLAYVVNAVDADYGQHNDQSRFSLGMRYEAYKNMALKLQLDHVRKTADPLMGNVGTFRDHAAYPNFPTDKRSINLVSLNLDFVF